MPDFKVILGVLFRLPKEPVFACKGHVNSSLAKSALQYDPQRKLQAVVHECTEIT